MNGICDDFANTEGNSTNLKSLVTQPMMQHQPNCTELRLMDSYIQILCRFQKCKRKVSPPSLLSYEKSPFIPPKKDDKNLCLRGYG